MTPDEVRRALLEEYARTARTHGYAVEATAIRTESIELRRLLAHVATRGRLSLEQLEAAVRTGDVERVDPTWLARLARVAALQNFSPSDRPFATAALRLAVPRLPREPRRFHRLLVELLLADGRTAEARAVLGEHPWLTELFDGYYAVDVENPFGTHGEVVRWAEGFSRPFVRAGLEPVAVHDGDGTPFDRLTAEPTALVDDGPLVTVMMTTFEPEREPLLAAVRSVLAQSWRRLEVLVVDDASPTAFSDLLDEVAALDDRVRVIRLTENGGTYRARNVALREARGELVTNQDDDDWSHPRRVERQVLPLLADPELPGTRAPALAADEDLRLSRPGYDPVAPHAATLLFRTELARRLGGYLEMRKAADNELHQRLEAFTGRQVLELDEPLAVYRIRSDSLSRGDFRAGWSHPARRAFRDAYAHWHTTSGRSRLVLDAGGASPVPVPERFRVRRSGPRHLDVVHVLDWRRAGVVERTALDQVRALVDAGMAVGVAQLENVLAPTAGAGRLRREVRALVNAGSLVHVLPDDDVVVDLVVVGEPALVQFVGAFAHRWDVRDVVVAAAEPPERPGVRRPRYVVDDVDANVESLLGSRPLWAPAAGGMRSVLEGLVGPGRLTAVDLPVVLDPGFAPTRRRGPRSTRAVVGSHTATDGAAWPISGREIRDLYPVDGSVDVRFFGDTETDTPLRRLGMRRTPPAWLLQGAGDLSLADFLHSVDFYVSWVDVDARSASARPVVEAVATGAVAVLPPHAREHVGDVAEYLEPEAVAPSIMALRSDPRRYRSRSDELREAVLVRHAPHHYVSAVQGLLRTDAGIPNRRSDG
ncbi:glycosyltransferase [Actinotalea sp. AC32]|nr:glycosyltransferase [Actinotalea sp. AC32]